MERVRKNEEASEENKNLEEVGDETPETPAAEVTEEPISIDPDPIIEWKKIGGGSLRLPKKLVPPGGTFKARLSEVPKGFRDVIVPMGPLPNVPIAPSPIPSKTVYTVQPRGKSKSMFDIFGANGKRMNEQPLTKAVAERLKADLER